MDFEEGLLQWIKLDKSDRLNAEILDKRRSYIPIISAIVPPDSPGTIFAVPMKIPFT